MAVHFLGIRHHGVGSARKVQQELERIQPDLVLVEGPPEITEVFSFVGHEELRPPVAIMVYDIKDPKKSSFYPFAAYSPEWVAIAYANENQIPVKAIDMPAATSFVYREKRELTPVDEDPMTVLGRSAGFETGERFWEHHFENIQTSDSHFEDVMHVMASLRESDLKSSMDESNAYREAFMRTYLQEAANEMYENIVVVCGAWHAPAIADFSADAKADVKLLKKLPKTKAKVACSWIPWTNDRLSMESGYGAGILSPGWYQHLWSSEAEYEISWLTKIAGMLREKGMDISTAHVIETFRLARTLTNIRGKHAVGLDEMNDAVLSVMCMGDAVLLKLIESELIVGNAIGTVPDDTPKMPLQEDFEATIKKLRLKLLANAKQHDLDLRKEIDRNRSILFHRLEILEIKWARAAYARSKGTFKESWMLRWSPEMMINLLDKAYLGNTIVNAAQAVVVNKARETQKISEVAVLIKQCIPAELYDELPMLLTRINELSSISSDILDLMTALPPLVEISRYGDVRKSDLTAIGEIIKQLLIKVNAGLPNGAYGLDEDTSTQMFERIAQLDQALRIYSDEEELQVWYGTLQRVLRKEGIHSIIIGCVCRLLLDAQQFTEEEAEQQMSFALSVGHDPVAVAAWIEGFLKGSGAILIYDNRLWNLIYQWVDTLDRETFIELVPMLRRTFSTFEYGERRKIGEKAKNGVVEPQQSVQTFDPDHFDEALAVSILEPVAQFLFPKVKQQ